MEQQELDAFVAHLDEAGWKTMTPAEGGDIKEQIRHLAHFENRARLAASDPQAFQEWFEEMRQDPDRMTRHAVRAQHVQRTRQTGAARQ